MTRLNLVACVVSLCIVGVLSFGSLDVEQTLQLEIQRAQLNKAKINVLQLNKKEDNSSLKDETQNEVHDAGYTSDAVEEDDDDEEVEDVVDKELEEREAPYMMYDATAESSDVHSKYQSFFGSLKMEAGIVRKHKCNNKCYNPSQHQCCQNKIVKRPWRCCPHGCGNVCYNPNTHHCNNGKISKGKCAHKCGNACYNPGNKKCCRGRVTPKNYRECGRVCYNPTSDKCCNNRVLPGSGGCGCTRCGRVCFNPRTHKCCRGRVSPSNYRECGRVCYNPTSHKCCNNRVLRGPGGCGCTRCGRVCYNPGRQKCCFGRVTPKHYGVCGRVCYNPGTKKCCRGRVTPRNYRACGRVCYNPTSQKCCNNRVLRGSGGCGCTRCGGACIDARRKRCCHQRVINRNVPCISGSGPPLRITTGLLARRVGCFRDHWNRAIPTLERKTYILIGNYQKRPFAIEKCALAAAKRGWSVFAVQHQGWCASGPNAGRTYNKYGGYNTCRNGKGGPWGNDVYVLEGKARQRTTSRDICVFPFIYKGKVYNGCTRIDHNRPWCAITPNYDVDRLWGNC